jgi:hypothetical protein
MADTRNDLAVDLGAESGRTIIGSLEDRRLSLTETHWFPNGLVRLPGGLHWDVLILICGELITLCSTRKERYDRIRFIKMEIT